METRSNTSSTSAGETVSTVTSWVTPPGGLRKLWTVRPGSASRRSTTYRISTSRAFSVSRLTCVRDPLTRRRTGFGNGASFIRIRSPDSGCR